MDRIDQMRVFLQVVEQGGFTAAADVLGISRASASTAVQRLERRIGHRLLHRTTRRVATTHEGMAFVERCRRVVADCDELETMFSAGEQLSGHIGVSLPSRIARLVVLPELAGFLRAHPQLEVELSVTDQAVDLVDGRLDCAVRVNRQPRPGMVLRPIGDMRIINVASPEYLARCGVPQDLDDLADHHMIAYASPTTHRVASWRWQDDDGEKEMQLGSCVTVDSAEALIAACVSGLGLIQIPAYDVADLVAADRLETVLPAYRPAPWPISLLYLDRRQRSRRFVAFADWLTDLLRRRCCVGDSRGVSLYA